MKISEGIKLQGEGIAIPDCSRDDLPNFFKEKGFKVGAEIGVFRGEFSKKLCEAGIKLYAIDPWLSYSDYNDPGGQKRLNTQYEEVKTLLSPFPNCTIIKKTSMEAVKDFANESLDFVYIDGNHNFKYIAEDLCEWSKKVKKGGVISGHDYFYTDYGSRLGDWHVAYVVNAYTKAYNIKNWYVLGRKATLEGEKRDKWRSWMFLKQ